MPAYPITPSTPSDAGEVSNEEDMPAKPPATYVKLVMPPIPHSKPPKPPATLELLVDGVTTIGWIRNQAKKWMAELGLKKNTTFALVHLRIRLEGDARGVRYEAWQAFHACT